MCSIIAILLMMLGLGGGIAGFTAFSTWATTTASAPVIALDAQAVVTPEAFACASVSQAQDVTDMLAVADSAFESSQWALNVDNGQEAKTTATWTSTSLGAVAFLEWLHYDCGVSQAQIDQYYSPDSFKTLLANYSSYEMTASCSITDLELFQFDAAFQGSNYHIDYWVDQVSSTRVAGLMLVFPISRAAEEADYAGRLFPELPTCESAAG